MIGSTQYVVSFSDELIPRHRMALVGQHTYPEVHDAFPMGMDGWWLHDPRTNSWLNLRGLQTSEILAPWTPTERAEAAERVDALRSLPPVYCSPGWREELTGPTFLYEGWLFTWMFFPPLRRWEVAPVKRFDPMADDPAEHATAQAVTGDDL